MNAQVGPPPQFPTIPNKQGFISHPTKWGTHNRCGDLAVCSFASLSGSRERINQPGHRSITANYLDKHGSVPL